MLYDSSLVFAIKNDIGEYNLEEVNVFNLKGSNKCLNNAEIAIRNKKEIIIKAFCPFCEEYHFYTYDISECFMREALFGGCHKNGNVVFIIGKKDNVIKRVESYREVKESIYNSVWYE